jgi:diguanylate cyclase (GGDEF)-like protein/putative nucleotidyltransferase with HDIG domain
MNHGGACSPHVLGTHVVCAGDDAGRNRTMIEPTLLIVDDEPEVLDLLVRTLSGHHFRCIAAPGLQEAKIVVESEDLDLIISDLALNDGSGLDLLKYVRCLRPSLPAIIVTGFPSISVAEESLRLGAFDLIEKPFDVNMLVEVVNEAVATRRQQVAGLGEMLQVIERPAVFVDRRHNVLATNSRWNELVGCEASRDRVSIDDWVASDSSLAIGDLLMGTGSSDTIQAKLRLATPGGPISVDFQAVPFRERREQPGGYLITVEVADEDRQLIGETEAYGSDSLTGCLSHRGFLEALDHMRMKALRRSLPVTVIMIDIDNFRNINEAHGYDLGDRILQDLANEVRLTVRDDDLVGRYGGDEIAVALVESTAREAHGAASRLCAAIANLSYDVSGISLSVGLTIGVADCPAGYSIDNRRLLEQAQAAANWGHENQCGPVVQYSDEMAADDQPSVNREEIERLTREFTEVNESLKAAYVDSARALVAAVEAKDPYTRKHSELVAQYAEKIAREMNLPEAVERSIRYAAVLHDVGKIGIPDSILTKPGPLSPDERELIKQHSAIGANIVSHVSCMRREVPFIQHHHENWDGSGYPAGLREREIPIGARILRVADSFDALLSKRSYKESMGVDEAVAEILSGNGTFYDPRVIAAFEAAVRNGIVETVAASAF